MKKLMKALALVTVLCMALSVSVFAEVDSTYGSATPDTKAETVDVTVLSAGANKQVSLLIVAEDADLAELGDSQIMFIDQKQADANGSALFEDIKVLDPENKVDIYVGSETLGVAKKIGDSVMLQGVKEITLVSVDAEFYNVEGEAGVKAGVGVALTVNLPEGLTIDKMIWSFDVKKPTDEKALRRFSTPIKGENLSIEPDASGNVQFAATFPNGFLADNVEVSNVGAIFLTGEGTPEQMDHFTNLGDADYKKKD